MTALPLTRAQRTIWFDETQTAAPGDHSMADWMDFRGDVDEGALIAGLAQTLRELEAARCRYDVVDGVPVQTVCDDVEPRIEQVPLAAESEADRLAEAMADMRARLSRRYDLTDPPLAQAALYRLGPRRLAVFLGMHHLVCDGWSRIALYERWRSIVTDGPSAGEPFPPLVTLLDAEAAYRAGGAFERDRAHWARTVPRLPAPQSLATGAARPERGSHRASRRVAPDAVARIEALSAACGVGRAAGLIALTGLLVAQWCGQEATALTVPFTARTDAAVRRTPGMVANYLPLPVTVPPGLSLGELVGGVGTELFRMARHQRFRAEDIRRLTDLDMADTRPFGPYVNVLPQDQELDFGGCTARLENLSTGVVRDLMVTWLAQEDGALALHVDADLALHAREDVEAFADELEQLVARPLDAGLPLARLARRSADPDAGRDGAVQAAAPDAADLLASRLREDPEGLAVADCAERTLTRLQLMDAASALAADLPRGETVALLAEPGCAAVTAMTAALLAGSAWVPLDPSHPRERLETVLEEAGCAVIMAAPGLEELALRVAAPAVGDVAVVTIPAPASRPVDQVLASLPPVPGPDAVAYVLFTSGTTGRPKGAMVTRRGLANHLDAKVRLLRLTAEDVVVQNAPLTFDVSIWQVLAPLVVGGRTVPVTRMTAADPQALSGLTRRHGVTHLEVVPSFLQGAAPAWSVDEHRLGGTLKTLMVTGEAVSADLVDTWLNLAPEIPLINAYGPTECSDDVTHAVLTERVPLDARVPIGSAIPGAELLVLGPDLGEVPDGHAGELHVGGPCVGAGYIDDPRRTARTFVARPGRHGEVMYRTGDRVVRRADGALEFVERVDHQVKVNGQRVELGEVEAMVRRVPGVAEVACTAPAVQGHVRLAAHVVLHPDVPLPAPGPELSLHLRDAVSAWAPAHVVPTLWDVVPELPLTAHGKVDRRALQARVALEGDEAPGEASGPASGPADGVEALIASVMADVLGRSRPLARDEEFFRVGGDSISALQVVARLAAEGHAVRSAEVFQAPSPARLAVLVRRTAPEGAGEPAGFQDGDVVPTPIQQDLMDDARGDLAAAGTYAQHVRLTAPQGLTAADVEAMMAAVGAAHPALRQAFRVLKPGVLDARVRQAGPTGRCTQGETAGDPVLLASDLDPQRGVLWRGHLGGGVLVLALHHLVVDGVSWRILQDDLTSWWAHGRRDGEVLPEATPWPAWTRRVLAEASRGELVDAEAREWGRRSLGGTRRWRRGPRPASPARARRVLLTETSDERVLEALAAPGEHLGLHVDDLLLLALGGALAAAEDSLEPTTGQEGHPACVAVELEGHGRDLPDTAGATAPEVSRTVGWFTAAHPVLVPLHGPSSPAAGLPAGALVELLAQRAAVGGHGVGHGLLRRLNPQLAARWSEHPVPDVGFNYLGRFTPDASRPFAFEPVGAAPGAGTIGTTFGPGMRMRHALEVTATLVAERGRERLVVEWAWDPAVVAEPVVRTLATAWQAGLAALVRRADELRGLAGLVPGEEVGADAADVREALERGSLRPGDRLVPLRPVQRGMAVTAADAHARGVADPYVLQVVGHLEVLPPGDRLAAAVQAVVDANPALTLHVVDGAHGPLGVLRPGEAEHRDVAAGSSWAEEADADLSRPFDLAAGPAVRSLRVPDTEGTGGHAALTLHHAVVDGWSLAQLLADVLEVLEGRDAPARRPAAPPRVRERPEDADWWQRLLHGVDAPTFVGGGWAEEEGHRREVSAEELEPTLPVSVARRHGVTPAAVLTAAWGLALCELLGREDVLFGSVAALREAGDLDEAQPIGFDLATLPTRHRAVDGETVGGMLRRIQTETSRSREHGGIPLAGMTAACAGLREWPEPFDTALVVENFPRTALGGGAIRTVRVHDRRHYPVSVVAEPDGDGGWRLTVDAVASAREAGERLAVLTAEAVRRLADAAPEDAAPALRTAPTPPAGRPVDEAPAGGEPDPAVCRAVGAAAGEVLGTAPLEADESFFLAGGDSVSAMRLVNALAAQGYRISVRDVFTLRTPAGLARAVSAAPPAQPEAPRATVLIDGGADLDRELGF